jgi:hypothetical protein
MLVLGLVVALVLCLLPVLWGFVHSVRRGAWKKAVALGIAAAAIVLFDVWAIHVVAPKGGRTIAQLELPDGRAFMVRHYRFGWVEAPKVRFYARDTQGVWTRFVLIWELVDPNSPTLLLNEQKQEVEIPGVGWYRIQENDWINPDGPGYTPPFQLPPGIEPGEEAAF